MNTPQTHPALTDTAAALAAAIQPQTVTTDELQAMSAEQLCAKSLELNRFLTSSNYIPARLRARPTAKDMQLRKIRKSELIRLTTVAAARGVELPKFTAAMGCMDYCEWEAFMKARQAEATFNAARAEAVTSGEKRVAMIQRGMPQ